MKQKSKEWIKQADYDIDTAVFMFDGRRFFYAVFMCHLSIEKALKGLLIEKKRQIPPKTHNLILLISQIGIVMPAEMRKFLTKLNESSVATRYPEELDKIFKDFDHDIAYDIIEKSKEALAWIKMQF